MVLAIESVFSSYFYKAEKEVFVSTTKRKTAILIHGCHVEAASWESIILGESGRMGRIAKGLQMARSENAALLYFGAAASERDGKKESQITYIAALESLPSKDRQWLKNIAYCDVRTQNTTQEVEAAGKMCVEGGIQRLILVSSPTHIARCLMEAEKLRAQGALGSLEVMAVASDTCFAGSTPADVVVVEPPHRGDMPKWQTYRYVKAMCSVMRQGQDVFAKFLRGFGELLIKYGVEVTWTPLQ